MISNRNPLTAMDEKETRGGTQHYTYDGQAQPEGSRTHWIRSTINSAVHISVRHRRRRWIHTEKYTLVGYLAPNAVNTTRKHGLGRPVNICGVIDLFVDIGVRGKAIRFDVVERLATDVIVRCDSCYEHVEYIRPRKQEVEHADGTTVPIIRKLAKRPSDTVPLPQEK